MTDTFFNKEQVFEILSSPVGGSELARRLNVSPSTISAIRVGRLYAKFYNEFSEANKGRNMPPAFPIKRDRLYTIFYKMHERCSGKLPKVKKWYSEKGITVCKQWDDYHVFKDWALCNGYSDSLTIDRIDNDKGYYPENCRWVSMQEQQYNKSSSRFLEIDGIKKTVAEWAKVSNVQEPTIRSRVRAGWPAKDAITVPPDSAANNRYATRPRSRNLPK